jgi:hypothetical protein
MLRIGSAVVILSFAFAGPALAVSAAVSAACRGDANRLCPQLFATRLSVHACHHVPLLLIGAAVLNFDVPIGVKVFVIWFATGTITLSIYHWLVRPFAPMRFLLG